MKATRLRCEHREDVPCIDTHSPRFGWALEADGRGRRQTGYQIRVALDGSDLINSASVLWDSGVVDSEETIEVPYAGQSLPATASIAWTVRVRDETGTVHDWAEPAQFRTGVERWNGSWITRDRRDDPGIMAPTGEPEADAMLDDLDPAPYFRREFTLRGEVARATLYFTARGVVEMYVNGRRVGDAVLAPGWTDYDKRIEYQAQDVTELLRDGTNALGAIVGHGWYAGSVGFSPRRRAGWYGDEPELLCHMLIEYAEGGVEIVASDNRWRATDRGPIRYSDLLHGEYYDARNELAGWHEPGFDDRAWDPVMTTQIARHPILVPERAQPIRVEGTLTPITVVERSSGTYVFDLGQNMVGWARLTVTGARGARVHIRFAEMLNPDGSLYLDNLRSARPLDTFVLAGLSGPETFEPHFTFHGFRYVEVQGSPSPLTVDSLVGIVAHTDTPPVGSFTCSNELVNKLQLNIEWGQRGNFLSVPTDCPQRDERLGWLADAQVFLPTATRNMDVAAFITKWGDDILDAQSPEGAYSDVAPRLVCTRDGAPAWADAGVIIPWTHYRRYGDRRLLERHWPHMERYLSHLQRENPDLLWTRRRHQDYGDWLAVDEETPHALIATAYWAHDAALMAKIAHVLDLPEREEAYRRLHAGITRAFNDAFVSSDGTVAGGTQTAYLLALAFELVPAEHRGTAATELVANLRRRNWHLATGFLGVGLICPVLTDHGYADVAHRLLLQNTYPSWGYSIRQGATTIWERWDGWTADRGFQTPEMNSFNHYSLGSVGAWLHESVGGIALAPDSVAYDHVVIAPRCGELASARVTYRSVRGEFDCSWTRDVERFTLAATVPPSCRATLAIPTRGDSLLERGIQVTTGNGVEVISQSDTTWHLEIGSGTYEFESNLKPQGCVDT